MAAVCNSSPFYKRQDNASTPKRREKREKKRKAESKTRKEKKLDSHTLEYSTASIAWPETVGLAAVRTNPVLEEFRYSLNFNGLYEPESLVLETVCSII